LCFDGPTHPHLHKKHNGDEKPEDIQRRV